MVFLAETSGRYKGRINGRLQALFSFKQLKTWSEDKTGINYLNFEGN